MRSPIAREEARVTALHGNLAKMMRILVGATLPDQERGDFLRGLDPVSRKLLDPAFDLPEWVPLEQVLGPYQALEAHLGLPVRSIFGHLLAEFEGSESVFGRAIQAQDPMEAVRCMPLAWSSFVRGGTLCLEEALPGRAVLWTWAWDAYPAIRREMVVGFLLEGLGAAGARAPRVEVLQAPEGEFGDRFEVRWD